MTKSVSGRLVYEADPASVYAMYVDPEFVQIKNERTGGKNVSVAVTKKGDGNEIVAHRTLPLGGLPSVVQKFVGETVDTVETDVWQGPDAAGGRKGTITIDFGDAPLEAHGTFRLAADGEQTVCEVAIDVKAHVRLVGGKAESVASDQIIRAINAEEAIGQEWLATH